MVQWVSREMERVKIEARGMYLPQAVASQDEKFGIPVNFSTSNVRIRSQV